MRKKKKLSALLICSCELGKRSISFSLAIPQFIFSLGLSQPPRWNVTQSIILPRLARLLVVWFDGCRLQWPCLCLLFWPPWWPSSVSSPASSCFSWALAQGSSGPQQLSLDLSYLPLSYSQVNARLLQAALPEARGMPSVLGGGAGLLQRGGVGKNSGHRHPCLHPWELQVGPGWLLFN